MRSRIRESVEEEVSDGPVGGTLRAPPGVQATGSDDADGSSDSLLDAEEAHRWNDALEHPASGQEAWSQPHADRSGLGSGGSEAAANETLHGFQRSRLRREGWRHHWPLHQPAPACRGVLPGREDGDPGAGSTRPGSAPVSWQAGAARVRVLQAWNAFPLRGAGRQERPRPGSPRRPPVRRKSSWPSWQNWSPPSLEESRSTSSLTTTPLIRARESPSSWPTSPTSISTSPRPIPPGSTRSRSGSRRSSAKSSPGASSPLSLISPESSCASFASTTKTPAPSNGPIQTPLGESSLIAFQLLQATSVL